MRGFDRMKQESVKPQGFSAPSAGLSGQWTTPCANVAALCKSARRKMRGQMQFAKHFANQGKAKKQINRSTLMSMRNKIAALAFAAFAATAASTAAQAQLALDNGVSINTRPVTGSYTTIDLGSQAGTGYISGMPLSLSYANVNVNVSFANGSGLIASGTSFNPTPGQNFILSAGANGATFQFSSVQSFFAARWSSPDDANMLSFYNGSQLLTSVSGSQFRSIAGVGIYSPASNAAFNFSELGYDRVVATGAIGSGMEIGAISFSDQPVDIAPIPLNAASLGGLMSFLMMLAMRGKGGTQVMVRMALASILPRRRHMA